MRFYTYASTYGIAGDASRAINFTAYLLTITETRPNI